jgi:hypothetical protein
MLNVQVSAVIFVISLVAASSIDSAAGEFQTTTAGERVSGRMESVSGTVSVAGNHQRSKPLPVFKNRSFCGAQVSNETLLVGRHGGLRNAVVTFHPLDRKVAAQAMKLVLDNKQCAFAPHVQVATVGSDLLLKNQRSDSSHRARAPGQRDFVQRRLADMAPSDETAAPSRSH